LHEVDEGAVRGAGWPGKVGGLAAVAEGGRFQ
jgi:hypothetical protein